MFMSAIGVNESGFFFFLNNQTGPVPKVRSSQSNNKLHP